MFWNLKDEMNSFDSHAIGAGDIAGLAFDSPRGHWYSPLAIFSFHQLHYAHRWEP